MEILTREIQTNQIGKKGSDQFMMDEDYKKAWDNYLKLCKLSARDFFTNMIKEVGLNSPFEDGCIAALVEILDK